jgi:AcrR family transcriptional regulator
MDRDAAATRRRLLDAATAEFAAFGIAGARVDRIAAAARSNKAQIYHYFENKEGLFDAVFDDMCRETVDAVPIDAADLPGYAGRLFDSYEERPWVQRLSKWYQLERAGSGVLLPIVMDSNAAKVRAIADAQNSGILPTRFTAVELLGLVLHISGFWHSNVPEFDAAVSEESTRRRREAVVDAVAALIA